MKTVLFKLVAREVKGNKQSFITYSLLDAKGRWFTPRAVDNETLKEFAGQVVAVDIARVCEKEVETRKGTMTKVLVFCNSMSKPSEEELAKFNKQLDEFNGKSLENYF